MGSTRKIAVVAGVFLHCCRDRRALYQPVLKHPGYILGLAADTRVTLGVIAALPVFAWEMTLAVWLIAKGFKPSAIASGKHRPAEPAAALSAARGSAGAVHTGQDR